MPRANHRARPATLRAHRRGNQVQTFHPELALTQSQTLHSAGQYPLNRSCAKTPISKMGEKIFGCGSFGRLIFAEKFRR